MVIVRGGNGLPAVSVSHPTAPASTSATRGTAARRRLRAAGGAGMGSGTRSRRSGGPVREAAGGSVTWVRPGSRAQVLPQRDLQVEVHPLAPERLRQIRALHHLQHSRTQAGQPSGDAVLAEPLLGLRKGEQRGVLEIEDAAQVEDDDFRVVLV